MTAPLRVLALLPDLVDDLACREAVDLLTAGSDAGLARFEAVAWEDGPRGPDLRQTGPVSVVRTLPAGGAAAAAERALVKAGVARGGHAVRRRRLGLAPWRRHRPDVVYLTSPRAAPILRFLPAEGPPVVVMVPLGEMTPTDHEPLSDEDRDLLLARADRFLVQAEASRDRLVELGVPAAAMTQIGEPRTEGRPSPPPDERLGALRGRLGLASGTPVVVGSGPVVWQGGTDLFVRMLWILRTRLGHDVAGVWVGGDTDPLERRQLDHDISHMGLAGHVHVRSPEDEDALWLGDVHVVTSRQPDEPRAYEPAAARGQALVGFHTDALDRFVGDGAGRLYDFLDLEGLAAGIAELLEDDSAQAAMAARVTERFGHWHVPGERTPAVLALLRGETRETR